jgi:hypothetical protein
MSDLNEQYNTRDWYDPSDVVLVRDHFGNVVAYGVPKPKAEPVVNEIVINSGLERAEPPKWTAPETPPLPIPPHTSTNDKKCLACEWVGLRQRIRDAS